MTRNRLIWLIAGFLTAIVAFNWVTRILPGNYSIEFRLGYIAPALIILGIAWFLTRRR